MAITATIAGPIFNILIGIGLGQSLAILNQSSIADVPLSEVAVNFSLFTKDDELNPVSILPLGLLVGQLFSLCATLFLTVQNNYCISFHSTLVSSGIYVVTVLALIIYTLL